MGRAGVEDCPEDYIIVVPHAWRDDGLWIDMQTEAQKRIGPELAGDVGRTAPTALIFRFGADCPPERDGGRNTLACMLTQHCRMNCLPPFRACASLRSPSPLTVIVQMIWCKTPSFEPSLTSISFNRRRTSTHGCLRLCVTSSIPSTASASMRLRVLTGHMPRG